ncbi:MAG TPA: M23 family metallopeptidase [Rectinemataceae bacterium]|nr:M23 family metallopeptidase [Rectinemataceae bacterium]
MKRYATPNRLVVFILAVFIAKGLAAAQTLVAPDTINPGDPLLCWMTSDRPVLSASALLRNSEGKNLSSAESFFMPSESGEFLYGFLLAAPVKAQPGAASVRVTAIFEASGAMPPGAENGAGTQAPETRDRVELRADIVIGAKRFMKEDIPLDKANTAIRVAPDPAKAAESATFARIFDMRDLTAIFAVGSMTKPLSVGWRETAGFGDERRYLYDGGGGDTTIHGGVDLGAKTGSEVLASAAGRVAFAGPRIVTGNTIVLEHLPGLFSLYMHLSAIDVVEGDTVVAGALIGRVGSTGLSTGPHLHWEIRVGNVSVNPYYWLSRPLLQRPPLDKDAVSGKIGAPAEGR